MLKRTLAVMFVALMVASISAVAVARSAKNHRFTATSRLASISNSKTYPAAGSTSEDAVITDSHPGGRSAGISTTKITGTSAGAVTFTTKSTDYTTTGLQFNTSKGTAILHADGSASLTGSGRYTGGTGAFKGLTGTFTFTGTLPKLTGSVLTLHIKGTLSY
jgi:hypothetical protein